MICGFNFELLCLLGVVDYCFVSFVRCGWLVVEIVWILLLFIEDGWFVSVCLQVLGFCLRILFEVVFGFGFVGLYLFVVVFNSVGKIFLFLVL